MLSASSERGVDHGILSLSGIILMNGGKQMGATGEDPDYDLTYLFEFIMFF